MFRGEGDWFTRTLMFIAVSYVCTMKKIIKWFSTQNLILPNAPKQDSRVAGHLIKMHRPPVNLFIRVWNLVRISWILDPIQCIIVFEDSTRFQFKTVPCLQFEQDFRINCLHFSNKFYKLYGFVRISDIRNYIFLKKAILCLYIKHCWYFNENPCRRLSRCVYNSCICFCHSNEKRVIMMLLGGREASHFQ